MSQSLDRALTIIVACTERPRTLAELAEQVGVHRSTVLRLLQTMQERGFMQRTADGTWRPGATLMGVSAATLEALDLRTVAQPWMRRLGRELGHTIHLAECVGGSLVYVDKVEGFGAVRMFSRIGAAVQLHTAGVAKAFLAFCEPDLREQLLQGITYTRHTPQTIVDEAAFRAELRAVRAQGWAVDAAEHESFLCCVAVPVIDPSGYARGALSVTALTAIEPLSTLRTRASRLLEAAAEITRSLGEPTTSGATQ